MLELSHIEGEAVVIIPVEHSLASRIGQPLVFWCRLAAAVLPLQVIVQAVA
jgi:hypothetical protein